MKFKTIAAAAVLATAAGGALAQESAPIALTLTASGANTSTATFQRTVSGFFLDTFEFTPATFSGNVAVSLVPVSGPVNFFAALLNNQGFSFLPESGATTFAFQANVSADVPLSLQVLGFAGDAETLTGAAAVYSGTITATSVAVIPEPETYALMLAGLASIAALRRRRSESRLR